MDTLATLDSAGTGCTQLASSDAVADLSAGELSTTIVGAPNDLSLIVDSARLSEMDSMEGSGTPVKITGTTKTDYGEDYVDTRLGTGESSRSRSGLKIPVCNGPKPVKGSKSLCASAA
ncbi:unnamed protein product [Danaus chrysippus]|uniref:(African queen) hypothetical protein n=1 Tax=Danaus chrysippus TaxID=151541 RepID=A0A8J2W627_9NEOP|nr:unnamed protein product [Danaus chrysippus]